MTDKFTIVKSEDTDLVIEKKIVDAAIDKASAAEKIVKTYRASILLMNPPMKQNIMKS